MSTKKKLLEAAAGNAGEAVYVDDVFSTYVYKGVYSNTDIVNGIDLAGEGGLVWTKRRNSLRSHDLSDTERGVTKSLYTNNTDAEGTDSQGLLAFNSNGYRIGGSTSYNNTNDDYVSWTFRKQPGFFDIVTYTGDGVAGREIPHNLGSVPGMILVKRTVGGTNDWQVYHRSLGATKNIILNDTAGSIVSSIRWNDTEPTSTVFTVGNYDAVNGSGDSYVAYLFAHDAQDFGTDSDEAIIKCGSFTTTSTWGNFKEDLGFEPQWLLVKRTDSTDNWGIVDMMRGVTGPGEMALTDTSTMFSATSASDDQELQANSSAAESTQGRGNFYSQGYLGNFGGFANATYIYVAIRRPHKPASEFAATDLFAIDTRSASNPGFTSGFPVDFQIYKSTSGSDGYLTNRLTGNKSLLANSTAAEGTLVSDGNGDFDYNTGWMDSTANISTLYSWMWRRAPGFFDVVAYEGNQTARQIAHNLGAVPEMMWVKCRSQVRNWAVYHASEGNTKVANLNSTGAFTADTSSWNNTSPTSTHFTVGDGATTNFNPEPMIAYLFASVPGISKVGSYTGTGASLDIDCGFTNGARLVLLKRTDTNGNWFLWDTARGIVAGNDPYLLLNETSAESTGNDYIDPYSAGFNLTGGGSSINGAGGSFIFLAIA